MTGHADSNVNATMQQELQPATVLPRMVLLMSFAYLFHAEKYTLRNGGSGSTPTLVEWPQAELSPRSID